jgi:hypothetical protein
LPHPSHHPQLLGDHTIIGGRNGQERVRIIVAITGQSLSAPEDGSGANENGKRRSRTRVLAKHYGPSHRASSSAEAWRSGRKKS